MNLITISIIIIVCAAVWVEFKRQKPYQDKFVRLKDSKPYLFPSGLSKISKAFSDMGAAATELGEILKRSFVLPRDDEFSEIHKQITWVSAKEGEGKSAFNKDVFMRDYETKTIIIPKKKSDNK